MASSRPRADQLLLRRHEIRAGEMPGVFQEGAETAHERVSLAGWGSFCLQAAEPGLDALAVHAEVGLTINAAGPDDQIAGVQGFPGGTCTMIRSGKLNTALRAT